MIRRIRGIIRLMMGRAYPPVVFIEAGEDPTKDRNPLIGPLNLTMLLTIVASVVVLPLFALAIYPVFFPPKPVAAAVTPLATDEALATAEATMEATEPLQPTPTATIAPTTTPEPSVTPAPTITNTPLPTNTPAPTATDEPWRVWMTATKFHQDMLITPTQASMRMRN